VLLVGSTLHWNVHYGMRWNDSRDCVDSAGACLWLFAGGSRKKPVWVVSIAAKILNQNPGCLRERKGHLCPQSTCIKQRR